MKQALLSLLCLFPVLAFGQYRDIDRMWLFGVGGNALYDSYLSPLDYQGSSLGITLINERKARWGQGHVTSFTLLDVNGSFADNPSGNASFYDFTADFSFGWHYNWIFGKNWKLRAGALAEFLGGGTYSTRNGNNPAQGRGSFDLAASAIADYQFRVRKHHWHARAELDIPTVGAMFSPQYGQSYYEAFELCHYDHNVCATWPVNAPSARFIATLSVPVRKANIIVGYKADIRQSNVNSLERHAWNNSFVIGFTRHLNF